MAKCLTCGQEVKIGKWICENGITNHVVADKEYLLNDAPSDPGHPAGPGGMDSKRDGRTRICNIPPDRTLLSGGDAKLVPGGYVEFIRGRFATSDPEQQYWLDKKGGWCTDEQWRQAWLSESQQMEIERMKLRAEAQRLENERNELLAQVKGQKAVRA